MASGAIAGCFKTAIRLPKRRKATRKFVGGEKENQQVRQVGAHAVAASAGQLRQSALLNSKSGSTGALVRPQWRRHCGAAADQSLLHAGMWGEIFMQASKDPMKLQDR